MKIFREREKQKAKKKGEIPIRYFDEEHLCAHKNQVPSPLVVKDLFLTFAPFLCSSRLDHDKKQNCGPLNSGVNFSTPYTPRTPPHFPPCSPSMRQKTKAQVTDLELSPCVTDCFMYWFVNERRERESLLRFAFFFKETLH